MACIAQSECLLEMAAYESVILVKPEVYVYNVPPRSSNRAVRYVLYIPCVGVWW